MKSYGTHATTPPEGMFCEISFPTLVRLDEWTPDGRRVASEGFEVRDLPSSLMGMFKTSAAGGHDGAENVGSIDYVEVGDDGNVSGLGWLLNEDVGFTAARRIRSGALRGNSVDLVAEEYEVEFDEATMNVRVDFTKSKLGATTLVPVPAMEGACAMIADDVVIPAAANAVDMTMADIGSFKSLHTVEFSTAVATKVTKELPDASDWANPQLSAPTSVVVESDLTCYGHLALWDSEHLGSAQAGMQVYAPRSASDYAYFLNGRVETDAGMIPTGRLVIGGQHAEQDAGWTSAIDYYAATSRAWADVMVGEDDFGIWFAGRVRPGTADNDIYAARASGLSGDWRPIGRDLELVAALSVSAEGFPKPRAFAREGLQLSLIGAGMVRQSFKPQTIQTFSAEDLGAIKYLALKGLREEASELAVELEQELSED